MSRTESGVITLALTLVGAILTGAVGYFGYAQSKNIIDAVSTSGWILSFFGVLIALVQIVAIKSISQATREVAVSTRKRIEFVVAMSDVSKAIKLIDEIIAYSGNGNHHASALRLQDLHTMMIYFGEHTAFTDKVDVPSYNQLCLKVGVDAVNAQMVAHEKGKVIDRNHLLQNLMSLKITLGSVEGRLRYVEA